MHRFKIEDLISQDASGVIFRALDSETQQVVALRRFFPHGSDGTGLTADEQVAYAIALDRLSGIHHPALRSVICGGCDPVDGMPFIAMEWIDGIPLPLLLESSPLSADEAADLLGKVLEVCQLLSEVLAEEAVWVETELPTIIVGTAESGRGVTFCISPFEWLGSSSREFGLEPIIALSEEVMGWKGKVVSDHAAKGLGGWLRWLRGVARTASLHEARETLSASLGVEPPVPAKRLAHRAFKPPSAKKKKPASRIPMWIMVSGLLFAIGGGTWAWMHRNHQLIVKSESESGIMDFESFMLESSRGEAQAAAAPREEEEALPELRMKDADRQAAEVTAAADLAALRAEIASRGGVFTPLDRELLIAKKGAEVTLEGALQSITFSKSRKTMYLLFSENAPVEEPRGGVLVSSAPSDLTEDSIKPLLGKKVRLLGYVKMEQIPRPGRPVIFIKERAAIQVVE